jgi:hypothetical protein
MHRRRFLQGVAVTSAAIVAPLTGSELLPSARDEGEAAQAASSQQQTELWALMAPYVAGSTVGLGWSVQGLSSATPGAALLTLEHDSGEHAAVHLCGRAGDPRGVAHTDQIDMILMNRGDGQQPTDEGIGRVLKTLAANMRQNERRGAVVSRSRLMPHAMRTGHFGSRRHRCDEESA